MATGNTLKKERAKLPWFDIPFFIAAMLLLAIGLAVLYSASYPKALSETIDSGNPDSYKYIRGQLTFVILGLIAMFIITFIPYTFYERFILLFYAGCVVLLILVLFISPFEERRWILIPGIGQFQPSELAKLAVIMFLSQYISKNQANMHKVKEGIIIPAVIFGICVFLIGIERHLSGAILVAAVGIILIFAGGANFVKLIPVGLIAAAAATAWAFTNEYMTARLNTWIHPENDPLGDGFQILQSLYAIGSGGLFGLSFGRSRQKYLYLPEPQNDFIFSVLSEEMGYICALLVIILFAFLIGRGIYISIKAPDKFSSFLVLGITSLIGFQTILNLAVVTGSIPVTGISLPFFSYGGTAIFVILCEIGIVLQISRRAYIDKGS